MDARTETIRSIDSGGLMVVSDLHGNWADYRAVWQCFGRHKAAGEAQQLVFLGDLVHARDGIADQSADILRDLMARDCNAPGSECSAILGNHELPHIYHISLYSGNEDMSLPLEDAIRGERAPYVRFMAGMPLCIRTAAGVLLIHAGASQYIGARRHKQLGITFRKLRHWDHEALLQDLMRSTAYRGVSLWDDFLPAIGWRFREDPRGEFLWEMTMNKNEKRYGSEYFAYLDRFLRYMSKQYAHPQRMLVSGHIRVPEGLQVVNAQQVRISTSTGAASDAAKTYLLFDAAVPLSDSLALAAFARKLYPVTR